MNFLSINTIFSCYSLKIFFSNMCVCLTASVSKGEEHVLVRIYRINPGGWNLKSWFSLLLWSSSSPTKSKRKKCSSRIWGWSPCSTSAFCNIHKHISFHQHAQYYMTKLSCFIFIKKKGKPKSRYAKTYAYCTMDSQGLITKEMNLGISSVST